MLVTLSCPGKRVPVRSEPKVSASTVRFLRHGDVFRANSEKVDNYFQISDGTGFISSTMKGVEWIIAPLPDAITIRISCPGFQVPVRKDSSTSSEAVRKFKHGDEFEAFRTLTSGYYQLTDGTGFVKANVKNVSFDEVTSHDSGALIDEGSESHTQGQRRPSSYKHWKGRTTSDSIQYDNRLVESKADENSPFIVEDMYGLHRTSEKGYNPAAINSAGTNSPNVGPLSTTEVGDPQAKNYDVCFIFDIPNDSKLDGGKSFALCYCCGTEEEEEELMKRVDVLKLIESLTTPSLQELIEKLSDDNLHIVGKLVEKFGVDNFAFQPFVKKDRLILFMRASDDVLHNFAINPDNQISMLANEEYIQNWIKGNEGEIRIETDETITSIREYEYIYLNYSELFGKHKDKCRQMFKHSEVFEKVMRLIAIKIIMDGQSEMGCLELKLEKKINEGKLAAYFPLHDTAFEKYTVEELSHLMFNTWEYYLPYYQPLEEIRAYFGAKIALYYAFLDHFSRYLTVPAIVGLGCQLVVAVFENLDHPIVAFYSIFIVLWAVVLSEYWKRREKYVALYHGMTDFEKNETYRGEFKEEASIYLIGREVLHFNPMRRAKLIALSFFIVFILCAAVIGSIAAIYVLRDNLASTNATLNANASTIASILSAVQIQIFGYIYGKIKIQLTDNENHRTDTEYEDSMIFKDYLFAFVNSYSSFFYLAFFAGSVPVSTYPGQPSDDPQLTYQGQCGYSTCMESLAINLGIVLGTNVVVGNVTQLLVPYMLNKLRRYEETGSVGTHLGCCSTCCCCNDSNSAHEAKLMLPQAEKEFFKQDYDNTSLTDDYLDIMILFGFMTMFVTALPGSSFIVLFALWAQIKSDAWRMLILTRRPWPNEAEDIGTWQDIIDLVVTAAVITNAALIVFTMKIVDEYSDYTKFWIFVGFQWVIFSIQFVLRQLIPDEPLEVTIQKQRSDFFNKKIAENGICEFQPKPTLV